MDSDERGWALLFHYTRKPGRLSRLIIIDSLRWEESEINVSICLVSGISDLLLTPNHFTFPCPVWKVIIILSRVMTESEMFVLLVIFPFLCFQLHFF